MIAWSATRARTFQQCRRRYYYRYFLAPEGRRPGAPPAAALAHRVKDLVGVEAWAGQLAHHVIEEALNRWRAGRDYSPEEAERRAAQLLSRQFRDSREYWTADPQAFPRQPPLLDMHYYGGDLSRDRAALLRETVTGSLRSLLTSDLAARIRRAGPQAWRPIDRNAAAHLPTEGGEPVLVLLKPDFAFEEDGRLHILDWKTGRPDPFWEMVQVTCYALYARERWGYSLECISPRVVHLHPELREWETDDLEASLRDVQLLIRESHAEMAALTPAAETLPPTDGFPVTEDCGQCRWCPFRGFCDGALRAA